MSILSDEASGTVECLQMVHTLPWYAPGSTPSAAIPADSLAASAPDPNGTLYGRFESPCGSDAGRMMILLAMMVR